MKYIYTIGLLFLLSAGNGLAAATPKAAVERLNKGIVENKKDKRALFNAISESFDLNRVAVFSIGRARWKELDKKQRKEYVNVFTRYLIAVYQARFNNYQGGGLDIYKEQIKGGRALVKTRIKIDVDENTLAKGKPIDISFSVYRKKNNWLINDVYFKGTISEVAGFRAQFAKSLKEKKHADFIAQIKKKCLALKKHCRL